MPHREHGALMTADELFDLPDDGLVYELDEGKLICMTPSPPYSSVVAANLHLAVGWFVREHRLGICGVSEGGFKLASNPDTVRAPDVWFVQNEGNNILDSVNHPEENRYRLISLREIVETLRVAHFVGIGANFRVFDDPPSTFVQEHGVLATMEQRAPDEFLQPGLEWLRDVLETCAIFGLNVTAAKIRRTIKSAGSSRPSYRLFSENINVIRETLNDELDTKLFLHVLPDNAPFYVNPTSNWDRVIEQFPTASLDIEEASKCFALERYTASVYHLMRVAEFALSSIAKRVGLRNERPGWVEAINYIDKQLREKYEEMSEVFKGDTEFLSGVAAHMRLVNLAWRRRVAHIERTYSREEAKGIYDSTLILMLHIAKKLAEVEESR
jgi:hypothetical protein